MNHLYAMFSTCMLVVVLAATGCTPSEAPEPEMEGGDDVGITLQGDFRGPLGLQLWSVRDSLAQDVPGTLARLYDMGFREVELAGTYDLTPEQFSRALEAAGLEATSMHVSYDRLGDDLDAVLDEAELFGVDYVGVAWIPHDESFTVEDARDAAADFNAWGAAAAERGVTFFYHIHGYEFRESDDGTVPLDVMMEETDPDLVKYEIDVFWATLPGADPVELLRQYPDRWELMHIKGMREGTPLGDHTGQAPPETDVPVGTGQIDYPAVLQAAQEIGLDRYYIEDESTEPFESIPQSIQYLETVTF